ncbi:MAG: hypothetical protein M5U25_20765 [Planctomycetota bacterium]|nr:hypothetical protein [Planctomycetota bacterium]
MGEREVERAPVKRAAPVERVPAERVVQPEQVLTVPNDALVSRRGCLALIVLGLTVGTIVWLWYRHETVFPVEFQASVGLQVYPAFYRDLSVLAVTLVSLCWLWVLRWQSAEMRQRALLATLAIAAAVVFVAWIWTQPQFQPETRDKQLKELATWATTLLTVAVLYRLLRR